MIKFGVIGYGYWGPNVVRNLSAIDGSEVVLVCDKSPDARRASQKTHPGIPVSADAAELVSSNEIDAIAVVTPVWTHYELVKAALENGKHVFVEKPFTSSAEEAEELIELAIRKNLKIMVDHTFLFTGAVKKIHQLLEEGASVPVRVVQRHPVGDVGLGDGVQDGERMAPVPRGDEALRLRQHLPHLVHHRTHMPVSVGAAHAVQRVQDVAHLAAEGGRVDRGGAQNYRRLLSTVRCYNA